MDAPTSVEQRNTGHDSCGMSFPGRATTFKGVGPGGFDIYEVKFENGLIECRIGLTPDGKIEGTAFVRYRFRWIARVFACRRSPA
jgi:hypothetical protein